MKKILVVGINYFPENIGTGKYNGELCEWLARRGYDVRVITAYPYYPDWEVKAGYKACAYTQEIINGVKVFRCPIWLPKKPGGITRLLHLGSFAVSSSIGLLKNIKWKPDFIINIAPTLASAPGAWLLSKISRAGSCLHIQDFELDAAIELKILNSSFLRYFATWYERILMRRFDYVSTISEQMVAKLDDKNIVKNKQILFRNWVNTNEIYPLVDSVSTYRDELNIPQDAVVALYSGSMGLKQGLELLTATAKRLSYISSLYFVFGGAGPAKAALMEQCRNLNNVRVTNLQPAKRLNEWLGLADIHLLPQKGGAADLVMPSKLTGMLASGRPVLATATEGTGLERALKTSGIVVEPDNLDEFSSALIKLAADGPFRRSLGMAARQQALDVLSHDAVLERFELEVLKSYWSQEQK
jgi:colanic acid biosynthesis glycosyl transferase WcaI